MARPIKKKVVHKNLDIEALSFGRCANGVLIVTSSPTKDDVENGELLTDAFGEWVREHLQKEYAVRVDRDCYVTTVLDRVVSEKKYPDKYLPKEQKDALDNAIRSLNPSVIFCIGSYALKHIIPECPDEKSEYRLHGRVLKSEKFKCDVACVFDGSDDYNFAPVAKNDFKNIFSILKNGRYLADKFDHEKGNILLETEDDIIRVMLKMIKEQKPIAFDYETNTVDAFWPEAKTLTVAISNTYNEGYCIPLQHPEAWKSREQEDRVLSLWKDFILCDDLKFVVQNYAFESVWTRQHFGGYPNIIYDTMNGYHVIDGAKKICSLDFQVYEHFGKRYKSMVDIKNLINEPLPLVAEYNALDARYTLALYLVRKRFLAKNAWAAEATEFVMRSCRTAAEMQYNGIGIDRDEVLSQYIDNVDAIVDSFERLKNNPVVQAYESDRQCCIYHRLNSCGVDDQTLYFGIDGTVTKSAPEDYIDDKTSAFTTFDKRGTMNDFAFKYLKLESPHKTKGGFDSTDAAAIAYWVGTSDKDVADVFSCILEIRKCSKLISTYLSTYEKLTRYAPIIHPVFALHTTATYRSSYFDPNLQNIPKRNEQGKVIRRCFVPKLDVFLDGDFKGAEVKTLGMYAQDQQLTYELMHDVDFHTYWAAKVFEKEESEVTKAERATIKQNFVFLLFYGGWHVTSAQSLGVPVKHIETLEKALFDRYPGVKAWQNRRWAFYKKFGYVENALGFRRYGPLKRRHVINTPVQGSSFQLLLNGMNWFTEILRDELEYRGFKSHVVLQIHDELVIDCAREEVDRVKQLCNDIFTAAHYAWQGDIRMSVDWSIGEKNFAELAPAA